ncbi:conserved membrane hypothetical protein [Microbacterium sp. C448]|uniref:DUF6541 family protein n=1 Tax=Microbacterium sp. C448 TaxID=1177594 RepID=UPI0003DDFFE2|nr:DUF6541 family protein [Microbacterium sp. C448]CDK01555.1 conserved membrane hypothetical protein [Microbacterium sp. C448]
MWLDLALASVVLIVLVGVVGGALAWAVGLRGPWAIAATPAFAVTIVGGTAIVAPWLGLSWSIIPVLLVTLVLAGAFLGARSLLRRRSRGETSTRATAPGDDTRFGWTALAILLAATILAARFVQVVGEPDAISQTFDNVFHLNGVRFILETGNASSLHLGFMTSPGGGLAFYPAAWHGIASLIVQLSGVAIPVAVNALTLVSSAVFWPAAVILLSRAMFGSSPVVAVATGLIAASIPAFPILLYDYGVLFPFQLGLSVLPFALAASLRLCSLSTAAAPQGAGWWVVILAGSLVGLALAHPGAFVAWLALSVPMVCAFAWEQVRRAGSALAGVVVVSGFVGYLALGAVLVRVLRPPAETRGWPLQLSMGDALATIFSVSMWYLVPATLVAIAVIAGIVWALIERSRSALIALGIYVIGAWLFFVVSSLPFGVLRDQFTGPWYNNLPRLAAILAIAMVPLAAYGASRTWAWVGSITFVRTAPSWARSALGTGAVILALAGTQTGAMERAVDWARSSYGFAETSALLSPNELALLERLDEHVPADVGIAGDPYTGTALAYAFSDRPVLMPHTLVEITPDMEAVAAGLAQDPGSVCGELSRLGIGFVLDFGTAGVHGLSDRFPGLHGLEESGELQLVDSEGTARLFEIAACDVG